MAEKGPFTCYTVPISLQLKGPFNITAMRQAVQKLVERHEALRTSTINTKEQCILPFLKVDITLINFSSNQGQVTEWMTTETQTPFNLSEGPLFRFHILKLEEQRHILVLVIHHLLADGLSMGVLLEELATLYSAECQSVACQLNTPLPFSELTRQPDQIASYHEIYLKQFAKSVSALELPTDHPRPSIKSFLSSRQTIQLDLNFCRHLKKVSQNHGISLFMMLLSGYLILLHKLTGQADIIVGILSAGRTVSGSETVVGNCRHLIPIRSGLVENQTFTEYLATLKQVLLEAYEHQDYAFAKLFNKWLAQKPSLIATTFNLDRVVLPNLFRLEIEAVSSLPINFNPFDLSFNVVEIEDELVCDCDYNPDVFEASTIRCWLGYFQTLLEEIVANPNDKDFLLTIKETNMTAENKVHETYESHNAQDLTQQYEQWATDYDQNMDEVHGAKDRKPVAKVVAKYVSKEANILDAGTGTGLLGEDLHQLGYHNLKAMDISEAMLKEARKKNVYTALQQGILGEQLNYSTDSFDAVLLCGVFTYGHAPSHSLDELLRITKPGGYIIFTMRTDYYEESDFKDKQSALETSQKWALVERSEKFIPMPKSDPDVYMQVWVYRVN